MAHGGGDLSVIQVTTLEQRIETTKWLLHPSAGSTSCCIFKVPQFFVEINKNRNEHLEMMQQHKLRFLHDLLACSPPTGPRIDDYLRAVAEMEEEIRGCYSMTIDIHGHDLAEMIVMDGLFVIELFCKEGMMSPCDPDDCIFNLAWIFPTLIRDLLRLENQVPFFVLEMLLEKSKCSRKDSDSSLSKLALEFFDFAFNKSDEVSRHHFGYEGKHLLDLLRLSFVASSQEKSKSLSSFRRIKRGAKKKVDKFLRGMKYKTESQDASSPVEFIKSARKLHLAGIKFKKRDATSFLDIKFDKGVLEIPHISLDDLHADILLNCIAFEACHTHFSKDITTYAAFMSCLIRTPTDVTFLCSHDIIDNYLGSYDEVSRFFRNLGKDVPFDIDESYLRKVFEGVNDYCRNVWHVEWAGFKFKYFDTPWSFLSALAAVVLLLFTAVQSYFAVYAYVHPPK